MAIQYPDINGKRYSFASIEAKINGAKYLGFKSINYSDGIEPGIVKGTSPQPLGRTRGEYSASGDCEVYLEEAQAVIDALGEGWGEKPIQIVVQFAEDGKAVQTHQLNGVLLTKAEHSNAVGTDASSVKFTMSIISPILRNGKSIIKQIDPRAFSV